MLASRWRDPKRRPAPFAAGEFNPYSHPSKRTAPPAGIRLTRDNITMLKVFLPKPPNGKS